MYQHLSGVKAIGAMSPCYEVHLVIVMRSSAWVHMDTILLPHHFFIRVDEMSAPVAVSSLVELGPVLHPALSVVDYQCRPLQQRSSSNTPQTGPTLPPSGPCCRQQPPPPAEELQCLGHQVVPYRDNHHANNVIKVIFVF